MTGNVNQESMVKEEDLCYRSTSNIVLFTDLFLEMEECMLFCEKLPNTRSPSVTTDQKLLNVMEVLEQMITNPATGIRYPGVISNSYWMPSQIGRLRDNGLIFTPQSLQILKVLQPASQAVDEQRTVQLL